MKTPKLLLLFIITVGWSCTHAPKIEVHQGERDNVINVREKVKEIVIDEVLIGGTNRVYLLDDYLIVADSRSFDRLIHLFDKKSFNYITSVGYLGQGPGEIANMGHIATDETRRLFYVSDHGKQRIFSYNLDSVLANPLYMPTVKMKLDANGFPGDYTYFNDTLSIGLLIEPIGSYGFNQSLVKFNMDTGAITPMPYVHPEIEKKRISYAASVDRGMCVECYSYHDLMTLSTFDGELICNIYGPYWDNRKSNKISYFGDVSFYKNWIIASYSGGDTFTTDESGKVKSNQPTKLMVFSLKGEYIKTLETGYQVYNFCCDEANDRLILSLIDEIQFAYLSLDGLID